MKKNRVAALVIVGLLAVTLPIIAAYATTFASQAASQVQFESSLTGSMPSTPIASISSGGVPWVITASEAGISPNGMLNVNVVGLLITGTGTSLDGTTGTVSSVYASLVCQTTGVVASTSSVPLSSNGNAHINQVITLPSTCFGPIILIRITGPGLWIAATGFAS